MTEPENYTAAQAADPQTPAQVLADIAALRPDLRAAVAGNPATYPALLEWLGSLGEPAVAAAIAGRGAPAAPEQPTMQMPVAAAMPAASSMPPTYGAPPGQPGYPGYPVPPKKSNKTLWVVLGIVGGVILLGVIAIVAFNMLNKEPGSYGTDASMDRLWDRCEDGDWQACDDLFRESVLDTEYMEFGDTCGHRQPAGTGVWCVDSMGGGVPDDDIGIEDGSYGSDSYLDGLWDACSLADWAACDDLFRGSEAGTEYSEYGDTCGGYQASGSGVWCVDAFGDGGGGDASVPYDYGDSAVLDGLWDACDGAEWESCDNLFRQSESGTEYQRFGDTCGNRQAEGTGVWCTVAFG